MKKQEKKLFQSAKTNLILVVSLLVAVPLICSVLINLVHSTSTGNEQMEKYNDYQSQVVEADFFQIVATNYAVLQTVANSSEAREMLMGNLDTDYVTGWLEKVDGVLNDGSALAIVDANGMQVINMGGVLADVSDSEFFQTARDTKNFFASDLIYIDDLKKNVCVFVYPILDDDQNFIGMVERDYDLTTLSQTVRSLVTEEKQDIFVVDNSGNVIGHSSIDLTESPVNLADQPWFGASRVDRASTDSFEYEYEGTKQMVSYRREPLTGWTTVVTRDVDVTLAPTRRVLLITGIIGILMLGVAIFITYLLANSFTKPVFALDKSISRITEGYFEPIDDEKMTKRKDEFGDMINNTNTVIESLKQLIGEIKGGADRITTSSEDLSDMANQISGTAADVSNAVQEIATGATQQANEIQSASENVGFIGDAVSDVQDSTVSLEELAGKMKEASEVSGRSLSGLQASSADMTCKIDDISAMILATRDAVSDISEKVEGITSIATQTNLLSLNASIEAARAGEAGRGFAVVAEEIGKLADDSKRMADDIKQEMEVLLRESGSAVSAADEVKSANLEQQTSLSETIDAINGMIEDINVTVGGVQSISRGAEQCNTSRNVVVDNMNALSAISQENAASSEETGASMQELSATVTTLAGSASDLKDVAEKLNKSVAFFKV